MGKLSAIGRCAVSALALMAGTGSARADTLLEALAKAYLNNPSLSGARAQQRATDEQVAVERSAGLPSASATVAVEDSIYQSNRGAGSARQGSLTTTLNVPIYQGGAVRNSINAAKLRVEAGQNTLRATESSVFSAVVAAYMDVIRDSSVVRFNQQNVEALATNLQASSDRFEVGDLTRTDVAQSQSRLALAEANLRLAEAQLIESKERYISLVGSAPDNLQPPPPLPGLPALVDEAVGVSLVDNPDIRAAQKALAAAGYDVKAVQAQVSPRVSAFATNRVFDSLDNDRLLQTDSFPPNGGDRTVNTTVGVQVNVPLYQGGLPGALSRQQIARESAAIEQAVEIERSVIAQTRSAFATWQASIQAIDSNRLAVESAQLSLEGVQAENSAGLRTVLDILDAQRDVLNAQVQLASAQRNAYVAGFSLLAAMGHAEARDLSLPIEQIYDADANYRASGSKFFDFQFGRDPVQQTTSTATVPAQTKVPSDVILP